MADWCQECWDACLKVNSADDVHRSSQMQSQENWKEFVEGISLNFSVLLYGIKLEKYLQ